MSRWICTFLLRQIASIPKNIRLIIFTRINFVILPKLTEKVGVHVDLDLKKKTTTAVGWVLSSLTHHTAHHTDSQTMAKHFALVVAIGVLASTGTVEDHKTNKYSVDLHNTMCANDDVKKMHSQFLHKQNQKPKPKTNQNQKTKNQTQK